MATLPQGFEIEEQPQEPPAGVSPAAPQPIQQQVIPQQQPIAPQQQVAATLPAGFEVETQPEAVEPSLISPERIFGRFETLRTIGSAGARAFGGGVAGIAQALTPGTAPGAGGETAEIALEDIFQPTTEAGKAELQKLGDLVQRGIDIFDIPLAGVGGILELVSGQGIDQAVETIKAIRGETPPLKQFGGRVLEETGSPAAATIAEVGPEAILAATGLRTATAAPRVAGRLAGEAGEVIGKAVAPVAQAGREAGARVAEILKRKPLLLDANTGLPAPAFVKALESKGLTIDNVIDDVINLPDNVTPKQAVNLVIKDKILGGSRENALAPFRISKIGAVVDDEIANEALRQGFQVGDVQAVKTASDGTKSNMNKMLKITRRIRANSSLRIRPTDVVGQSVLDRFTHIRNSANDARLELDNIAKAQLSGTTINVDGVRNSFLAEMDKLDVGVDTSTIPPKLDFEGSLISKDRTSQRVIKDVVDLLSEDRVPNALRAHKLKRQLDTLIDFRKKAVGGLTEAGRNVAKSLRKSLNESIRDVSDDYADVNDILSESIGALDEFQRVLGPSIDVFKEGAKDAIGQDLRGLLSNRKSRVRLQNSVNALDATAKKLGGQFNDDINDLVNFAEILDDQFGAVAKTGFKGQIASGLKQAARGKAGAADIIIEKGAEKLEKLRGINEQSALKAMEDLLRVQQ